MSRAVIEAEEATAAANAQRHLARALNATGKAREAIAAARMAAGLQKAATHLRLRAQRCVCCAGSLPDRNCPVCGRFYQHG